LDRFDLAVLLSLAGLSLAFLFWILVRGGVFAGWEGFVVADQGQYLSWVREASENVLMANRFDMQPDSHVYLHPALLLSGLVHAVGVSTPLAYLLWKPVAVAVLFVGVRAYIRRTLESKWERRVALVLALFFVSPAAVLSPLWGEAGRGTFDFISGEISPPGQFWGYPFGAIAIGLTPLVFLWAERALHAGPPAAGGRWVALAAGAALVASALHPWQGAIIIGVLGVAGLWHSLAHEITPAEVARKLWPVFLAPLLPALYYFVLARVDASWEITESNYSTPLNALMTARVGVALAPLALAAVLAYLARGRRGFQDRILLLWAPLVVVLYLIPATPVRFHAFNGLSIPLAILAVRGLSPYLGRMAALDGHRRRLVGAGVAAACAFLIVPGTFDRVRSARGAVYLNEQPYLLEPGERDALDALERAPEGGVMAPVNLAALVPYRTGHETWVGTPSWSPDFGERAAHVSNLFAGRLSPQQGRRLVRTSGVRYVLADCRVTADLRPLLAPLADATPHGCATLFELRRQPQTATG